MGTRIVLKKRRGMISLWRSNKRPMKSIKKIEHSASNKRVKEQAKQNFVDTDYALKL